MEKIKKEFIQEFDRVVSQNERFVLTTHLNADGDAIGSEITLCRFLLSKGKTVRMINREPIQEVYRFLCSDDCAIEVFDPAVHSSLVEESEVIFLIDNSTPTRFGAIKESLLKSGAFTFCIDHHPEHDPIWDFNIIDENACATAEIVYDLLTGLGEPITLPMAEALYVAIVTDTGSFRFSKTNARTHEIIADLVRRGVVPQQVYGEVYERHSIEYVKLMGSALETVMRIGEGKIAYVTITRDMIDRNDARNVDTSDIINPILAIDDVKIAILFKELADGRSKVSLRSKGDIDVNLLATEFGGGGHKNASGIVMKEKLDETMKKVLDRLSKVFQ